MKITIDTKEDSHEEIRKVLHMLINLVNENRNLEKNTFEQVRAENRNEKKIIDTTNLMNMFSSSATVQEKRVQEEQREEKAPDFSSFLDLAGKKEKEEPSEKFKIEFF